jgi:hypothetical protein
LELAGLVLKLRGKLIGNVSAATAKNVELLERQDAGLYPPNCLHVFVPNVAFDIDTQVICGKLDEIIARPVINIRVSNTWTAG